MKFELIIREEAHANILRNAEWWAGHHSLRKAEEWLAEVYHQIDDLRTMPERHGLARETNEFSFDLRQKVSRLRDSAIVSVAFPRRWELCCSANVFCCRTR